ncbi:MAG TPA: hypothetical protein VFV34_08135, partial [Blastocatellia bacterium]|nr:hypothetical protein [Blastocatellia bacterium]
MNSRKVPLTILGLLLTVVASCSKGASGEGNGNAPARSENKVAVEAPAPVQTAGKTFVYNFDNDAAGQIPAKFHEALTGQGGKPQWVVQAETSASSQPNLLAQLSNERTDYRFPLAIADEGSFQDLDLSVKFKAVSGEVDRAAGLVFRLKDANNYY